MEIELKLLLTAQAAAALRKHPLLQEASSGGSVELQLSGTYFDTPGFDLRRSEAGLRVRRSGQEWVQTFKGGGAVEGGLHSRHEWETAVAGPMPELPALRELVDRKSEWGKLLRQPLLDSNLQPIFSTTVTRTLWNLTLPEGDLVECVLDQGEVTHAGQRTPISEIELELKTGDPTHLFDLALVLLQDIPMRIGTLSKADRGYALLTPQKPMAVKAASLKLSARMSIEATFQAIVANCMTQIQANESGVGEGHDVESLHQMRVGLRRLRSALGLFGKQIPLPAWLQQELDWLGDALGAPRDWDVLAGSTLPAVAQAAPLEDRIAALTLGALGRSHELHEAAAAAVGSPRYTRLVLAFTRWVQGRGWRETLSEKACVRLDTAVPKFAKAALTHARQRLQRRGNGLPDANASARHRVRIAAKKLRYATEFFSSLYPAPAVRREVKALSRLQDELGRMNDAAVADRLLKQLHVDQPQCAADVGYVRGYLASQMARDVRKLLTRWKKFAMASKALA